MLVFGLNLIVGVNGSGKISLLEVIYFIGSGGCFFCGGCLFRLVCDGVDVVILFVCVEIGENYYCFGICCVFGGI